LQQFRAAFKHHFTFDQNHIAIGNLGDVFPIFVDDDAADAAGVAADAAAAAGDAADAAAVVANHAADAADAADAIVVAATLRQLFKAQEEREYKVRYIEPTSKKAKFVNSFMPNLEYIPAVPVP
jgi:hypothetical protein